MFSKKTNTNSEVVFNCMVSQQRITNKGIQYLDKKANNMLFILFMTAVAFFSAFLFALGTT